MIKIRYIPLQEGYSVALGNGVYSIRTPAGPANLRKPLPGTVDMVTVAWSLDADEYAELVFMVDHQLARGAVTFLIDLVVDCGGLTEYKAQMVENTFGLTEQSGLTYTVGATLLVQRPSVSLSLQVYADYTGDQAGTLYAETARAIAHIGASEPYADTRS